jgi:hypothetical protein
MVMGLGRVAGIRVISLDLAMPRARPLAKRTSSPTKRILLTDAFHALHAGAPSPRAAQGRAAFHVAAAAAPRARCVRVLAHGAVGAKELKMQGFIGEMRAVAMKLHTREQAPKEGQQAAKPMNAVRWVSRVLCKRWCSGMKRNIGRRVSRALSVNTQQ